MMRACVVSFLALLAAGCGGKYRYGSLGEAVAQPKPKKCSFTVIAQLPTEAYEPLGVLAPEDAEAVKLPDKEEAFKAAIAGEVCAAGGDAVIAERNRQGRYVRATVVKLR
jgi:hypothetical protein